MREGVGECRVLVGNPKQVLVRNDDQRVDVVVPDRWIPASAIRIRCDPSNWNGLVTTATVRMPRSLAPLCAIAGSGPGACTAAHTGSDEHHMRTMQVLGHHLMQALSSAAMRPTSGLDPAPRPSVIVCTRVARGGPSWRPRPMPAHRYWRRRSRPPASSLAIMLLTALPPAPPTPRYSDARLKFLFLGNRKFDAHASPQGR